MCGKCRQLDEIRIATEAYQERFGGALDYFEGNHLRDKWLMEGGEESLEDYLEKML